METKPLSGLVPPQLWLPESSSKLIIAGPCSAESPEQLLSVAKELKQNGRVNYLRAGVWKPRTTPGSFQGVGAIGLEWLRDIKQEIEMPYCTEVGSEKHVYEALKFGVDRFDLIVLSEDGTVSVIKGTASYNPIIPTLPNDRLLLLTINVKVGMTEPNVISEIIYNENIEWATSILLKNHPNIPDDLGTIDFGNTNEFKLS